MGNQRFSITPARAARDQDLPDTVYRTLAVLGTYGDENGWCWPSLATIAEIRGMSPQAVSKHIKVLKKAGYLRVKRRQEKNKGNVSNLYQIIFDRPLSTSEVDRLSTSEVDVTTQYNVPEPNGSVPPKKSPPKPERQPTPQWLMMQALSAVTGFDLKLNKGRIGASATKLIKAGYSPEFVQREFSRGGWWYREDWRGKKGERPSSPEIVLNTVGAIPQKANADDYEQDLERRRAKARAALEAHA